MEDCCQIQSANYMENRIWWLIVGGKCAKTVLKGESSVFV